MLAPLNPAGYIPMQMLERVSQFGSSVCCLARVAVLFGGAYTRISFPNLFLLHAFSHFPAVDLIYW